MKWSMLFMEIFVEWLSSMLLIIPTFVKEWLASLVVALMFIIPVRLSTLLSSLMMASLMMTSFMMASLVSSLSLILLEGLALVLFILVLIERLTLLWFSLLRLNFLRGWLFIVFFILLILIFIILIKIFFILIKIFKIIKIFIVLFIFLRFGFWGSSSWLSWRFWFLSWGFCCLNFWRGLGWFCGLLLRFSR